MITADACTIQAQPVMREEDFRNVKVERPYFLRPTAQGVDVIKIPPQWTWQLEPVKKVVACLALKGNWDSYGGKVPSIDTVLAVIQFIDQMPANSRLIPRVVPLSTGGIQLDFRRGDKALEVEFLPDGRVHYLESDGDVDREGPAVLSSEKIYSWIHWLSAA